MCLDLVRLEFYALLVAFARFRNVAAGNLKQVRGFNQLQGTPANGEPLFVGVRRLLFFAVYGRDGAPDGVRGRIDDTVSSP